MTFDRETELRRNIKTGQLAEYSRMQLAVMARQLGLDPDEYNKPYPGNSVTVHLPPEPAPAGKALSWAKGFALAALGAAVPGIGLAGFFLGGLQGTPAPKVKPETKVISKDVSVDFEVIPPQ